MKSRKLWLVLAWELMLLCLIIFSDNFDGHFDWFLIASGGGVVFYCVINVVQKLKVKDWLEYEAKEPLTDEEMAELVKLVDKEKEGENG